MVAAFGLLVLAVAAALSFGAAAFSQRISLNDQGDVLHALARSTATVLADGLFDRMREVELLAMRPRAQASRINPADWTPVLTQLQSGRPQYSWIGITDPSGTVLAATGDMLVGEDVSARPWFQAARSQPHTGDVHPAKLLAAMLPPSVNGEPVRFIDFAAPVRGLNGELQGILGVHATWDWAQEVINSLRSQRVKDKGVQVFILDRKGGVIHRPIGVPAGVQPAEMLRIPDSGGAELRWTDGERYLTAAVRLPARDATTDMGWTIVVRQPLRLVYAASAEAHKQFVLIGAGAALLAIVLAWWLSGRFSTPLVEIAGVARRVEAGELHVDIPGNGATRELLQLSAALQAMKHSLLEREALLEQANAELERRVMERTASLEAAQTELERANSVLKTLALRDELTGLLNRRGADERLEAELVRHRRYGSPLSILLLDVDHFRSINDTLGHPAGDAVLRAVAEQLNGTCRAADCTARYGGEEFLVIMPETPLEGALLAAEKIRAAIAEKPCGPANTTVSVGVAAADGVAGIAQLLLQADDALYRAKLGGRNRVSGDGRQAAQAAVAA